MRKFFVILPVLLILAGCSAPADPLPVTEGPQSVAATPIPNTPIPVASPRDPVPLPQSTPASDWNGIPVMPNAIYGDEENGIYTFTVVTDLEMVEKFYAASLIPAGWEYRGLGEGKGADFLLFFREGKMLTITLLKFSDQEYVQILFSIQ